MVKAGGGAGDRNAVLSSQNEMPKSRTRWTLSAFRRVADCQPLGFVSNRTRSFAAIDGSKMQCRMQHAFCMPVC